MDETKPEVVRNETRLNESGDILVEDEPSTVYEVKWRTAAAIFALSLANCCAALGNTVHSEPRNLVIHKIEADLPIRQTPLSDFKFKHSAALHWPHG